MMTAAAQLLIQSTHALLDHPNKSPQKTADLSDDEAILGCTTSFDNEGQMTSPQEDDLEGIQLLKQREVTVAMIRPSVWAQDAADVRRIKQKQMPLGRVSESLVFNFFNPQQILEDILDLIMSRLSTNVFIDHCTTAPYQPNLDLLHIKHMYLKFKYAYMIQLCHSSVNFSVPQLFAGVLTPHTIKKHTIPGVMAKSRGDRTKSMEYKAVLCNFCSSFVVMKTVLTAMFVTFICVWPWGAADVLTLSVSHRLISGNISKTAPLKALIAAWLLNFTKLYFYCHLGWDFMFSNLFC